jgi:DNA-binding NarL/FixJ family response regulator
MSCETVALYCPLKLHLRRVHLALESIKSVAVCSWSELHAAAERCPCSVVLLECVREDNHVEELRALRSRIPQHSVIVVTREDPDNARCLIDTGVCDVIWFGEIDTRLGPVVLAAQRSGYRLKSAESLDGARHLNETLRTAIRRACLDPSPPRSVKALAATVQCHRSTLWTHWTRAVGDRGIRLEDFLDWLLLLSALERRNGCSSWAATADQVRVYEHTLGRIARRLTGMTLRELEGEGHTNVYEQFSERAMLPLLEKNPPTN